MMCQRSGARFRQADRLKFAARHLRTFRPGIVLIDVGLPDGSALALIRELSHSEARIGVVRAMSGDDALPDRIACRDDLLLAANLLASDADVETLNYVTDLLIGLANSADDPGLADVARDEERACRNFRHLPTASKGSEPQSKTISRQSRRSNPAGSIRLVFG